MSPKKFFESWTEVATFVCGLAEQSFCRQFVQSKQSIWNFGVKPFHSVSTDKMLCLSISPDTLPAHYNIHRRSTPFQAASRIKLRGIRFDFICSAQIQKINVF